MICNFLRILVKVTVHTERTHRGDMQWQPSKLKADPDTPGSALSNLSLLSFPTEKAMAPHSSALAWKIPWAEEPGGLQCMGSLGVGHD